jgi:hypothetical protein
MNLGVVVLGSRPWVSSAWTHENEAEADDVRELSIEREQRQESPHIRPSIRSSPSVSQGT